MDGTPCGACGATNPAGAPFCWRCYAPLTAAVPTGPTGFVPASPGRAPATPTAPGAGSSRAASRMPPPSLAQAPTSRARGMRPFLWLGALVVLVVGAWLVYIHLVRGAPELPREVAGLTRMTALEDQPIMQTAQERMRSEWTPNSSFGLYGDAGATVPTYIAVVGTGVNPTLQEHVDSLSLIGVPQTEIDAFTTSRVGDLELACGAVQTQTPGIGTACVAKDGLNVGMVAALDTQVDAAQAFTIELMQDVE